MNRSGSAMYIKGALVIFTLLMLYGTKVVFAGSHKKIASQIEVNQRVEQVRDTWTALQPTIETWHSRYVEFNKITDLLKLEANLRLEKSGLRSVSHALIESNSKAVTYEQTDIGLVYRCLKNSPLGFVVAAKHLQDLVKGLADVDQRPDLKWDRLSIVNEGGNIKAVYSELCLLMRVGGR